MFPQVARDVLKDFQGNQDGEQIPKNFDQPITQPIGISIGVNQRKTDPNGELDQGRHNHHGCDDREQLGYLLLCGVDEQQEGSTLTTGLRHGWLVGEWVVVRLGRGGPCWVFDLGVTGDRSIVSRHAIGRHHGAALP